MVLIRISQIFQKIILKTSQIFGINHIYCRCDEKESYNVQVNSQIIHSYSQYGEDLVIDGIFGAKNKGYYIDIGANDPILFNNTNRFYEKKWQGINIEPNPTLYKKIVEKRPYDQNLNIGIGNCCQIMPFYVVSADTLSSFDKDDAERNCKTFNEVIIETVDIQVLPLYKIFEKYAANQFVDFMSIDVEGYEIDVLQSNDWTKYRPQLLLIEINNNTKEIITFLKEIQYEIVYKNHTNGIFVDIQSLNT